MRFLSFLFTIWMCFILFRLVIAPLALHWWMRYLGFKINRRKKEEFAQQETPSRVYPEHVVDAEFEEIN